MIFHHTSNHWLSNLGQCQMSRKAPKCLQAEPCLRSWCNHSCTGRNCQESWWASWILHPMMHTWKRFVYIGNQSLAGSHQWFEPSLWVTLRKKSCSANVFWRTNFCRSFPIKFLDSGITREWTPSIINNYHHDNWSHIIWNNPNMMLYTSHLQEWKSGGAIFKTYRKYEPEFQQQTNVKLEDYPLRFCQVSLNPSKKGVAQVAFSLPQQVRALYSRNALKSEEWAKLIQDFDEKFLVISFFSVEFLIKMASLKHRVNWIKKGIKNYCHKFP